MSISESQKKATAKYVKNNYDRIEFKAPKGRKAEIKAFANNQGESVNAFLNRITNEAMGIEETQSEENS